jgi:cytochrome b561
MPRTADFDVIRYNRGARIFHWLIAVLVILNIILGLFHDPLGEIAPVMPFHKATGILILALSLGRIGWRFAHPAPPLPADVRGWQRTAAHLNHFAFYALMLLMPLSGWIMSSAGPRPISFYSVFDVPKFAVEKGSPLAGVAHEGHMILGYLFAALVVLHVAAALRHHFVLKDQLLRRMV